MNTLLSSPFWDFGPADCFAWNKSSSSTDRYRSQSTTGQRCEVRWFWIRLWPKNISKRILFHIRLRSYFIFAVNDFLFYFTDSLSLFSWTNVTPLGIWAQVTFSFLNASNFLNFIKDFETERFYLKSVWKSDENTINWIWIIGIRRCFIHLMIHKIKSMYSYTSNGSVLELSK